MGLLYVRTGNNGGDAAYLIADLGFIVPTGASWTLLAASSPEDADGSSGQFTAREIRDSADLYAAINGGSLEWSKDGSVEEDGADYVADYMLTQDFTDDFFDLSSGGLALPHGASLPASGIEAQTFWKDGTDELYVWDNTGAEWRLLNGADADGLYEPTGFENRTDSQISLSTNTFSIQPVSTDYNIYFDGRQVIKNSLEQVVITDVEGIHYIYFDYADDTLKQTTSFSLDLITRHVYVAAVYWDATNNAGILVGDERHGIVMDSGTHSYLHTVFGSQWISGLALGNMSVDGTGDDAADAQFAVSDGSIRDEDILHTITDDSPQDLSTVANIPVFYRSGASGDWRKKTADTFPLIYSGTAGYTGGSGLLPYNQWTGSTWQLTEVTNNDFVLVHYFATNDINEPVIGIQGQEQYGTAGAAQTGAQTEINSLVTDGLPITEWVPIATVIYETSTGHGNTPKARVISTADGDDYIDWRFTVVNPSGGVSTGDHGSLLGLGDDDHPQYHDGSLAYTGDLNMGGNSISGVNLVDGVDVSTLYSNYTSHAADGSIHFTEASIDHDNILNNGTYGHDDIDNHIDDSTIHYPQSGIDHGLLQGLDDDDHTQYVSLTGDSVRNGITGTLNVSSGVIVLPQAADVPGSLSGSEGSIAWDTDDNDLYIHDGSEWVTIQDLSASGVDHGALTGLGDDDHTQYLNETRHDALPADNPHSVTFTQAVTADGGTDISAAEAETLTNNSVADGLHYHTISGVDVLLDRISGSTYDDLQDFIDIHGSAGWWSGGAMTDGGGGNLNVQAGTGLIKDADSHLADILLFDWAASNGNAIPNGERRYIGVEYNGGSPQVVIKTTDVWNNHTDFPLGCVYNDGGTLEILEDAQTAADPIAHLLQRLHETDYLERDNLNGGVILGETGTRDVTVSAGALWSRLNRHIVSAIDTSGSDTFDAYYRNGGGGWTKQSSLGQWPNTKYDNNSGTLIDIANNKYGVLWFYIEINGSADLIMVYGQDEYSTLQDAVDATPPSSLPARMDCGSLLIGRIIFQESASTATAVESVFEEQFGTSAVVDHGNLSGLGDDDHPQYHDGSLAYTGDLNMGGNSISGVNLVDGVDVGTLYSDYTSHAADSTIHFTEGSIDHDNILNNGTNDHAAIDSHIADTTIHYVQSDIDHGTISGLADDDHTQYLLLSGDAARNPVTGKIDLSGGEMTLPQATNVSSTFTSAAEGDIAWDTDDDALYLYDGAQWIVVATSSGVNTDHGALTGLEDDDHPQYHDGSLAYTGDLDMGTNNITNVGNVDGVDVSSFYTSYTSHVGDSSIHFTEGSIDHNNILNVGTYTHSGIDAHIDDSSIHFTETSIDHGTISGLADDDHTQYVSLTGDGTRNAVTGKIDVSGGEFRLPQAADVITTFTSAEEGDMAWDTDDDSLWVYDGGEWFAVAPASGIITDHGELTGKDDDDHPQYTEWNDTETVSGLWTFDTAASDPAFVIAPDASAPSTNLADGAVSVVGGILYTYDGTRTKWLSVDRKIVTAAKKGPTKNVYLRHADNIATSETGFRALRDGTITGITAQSDTAGTWTLEIRKNDAASVITSVVVSAAQGNQDTTINVDFSQGDEIQFYANVSGSPVVSAIGAIEIAWRI